MTGVCIRRKIWTQRHTQREDDVRRHREKLVIYKPKREDQTDPFLTALRRNQSCWLLDFWTSSLQNCETIHFKKLGYNYSVCDALYGTPNKLIYQQNSNVLHCFPLYLYFKQKCSLQWLLSSLPPDASSSLRSSLQHLGSDT